GSTLDSVLSFLDSQGIVLGRNDEGIGFSRDSVLTVSVSAGQLYYVQAGAFGDSIGQYRLTASLRQDDAGDTFATAALLTLSPTGEGTQHGAIDFSGDVDFYQFVSPVTGRLRVQLAPAGD